MYARLELKPFPIERAEVEADARSGNHVGCNHEALARIERLGR
jgi:hypothetical protein